MWRLKTLLQAWLLVGVIIALANRLVGLFISPVLDDEVAFLIGSTAGFAGALVMLIMLGKSK